MSQTMNSTIKKTFCTTALITVMSAGSALAEMTDKDVVRDERNNVIVNTYGNCVLTKWDAPRSKCGSPSARSSRSYLVFFDYNKDTLTNSSRDIINKAYRSASRKGNTYFELTGHADRSGGAAYNKDLSSRRARSVKSELQKLGVASGKIRTRAKGESDPLVQTADGVREPQNRDRKSVV